MFSLHLTCEASEVDDLSFALWEAGTAGIREDEKTSDIELVAGFEDDADRDGLSARFATHKPWWEREEDTDWVAATQEAWPARRIGKRVFLAPVWSSEETPEGFVRVVHNPGMASGTGEHPCTQLALESLERSVVRGSVVVDVGTGSGILSTAALQLGARTAIGLDMDAVSLAAASENFGLNEQAALLVMGSADCVTSECANVVVANISGSVLLAIADELMRIVKSGGCLILTGFPESELKVLQSAFGNGEVTGSNEWRCLRLRV